MTYSSDPDQKLIGITVALIFIVVGAMFWAGQTGDDTAGKGKSASAPAPPTTGSGVNSRGATGPDTSRPAGR